MLRLPARLLLSPSPLRLPAFVTTEAVLLLRICFADWLLLPVKCRHQPYMLHLKEVFSDFQRRQCRQHAVIAIGMPE